MELQSKLLRRDSHSVNFDSRLVVESMQETGMGLDRSVTPFLIGDAIKVVAAFVVTTLIQRF